MKKVFIKIYQWLFGNKSQNNSKIEVNVEAPSFSMNGKYESNSTTEKEVKVTYQKSKDDNKVVDEGTFCGKTKEIVEPLAISEQESISPIEEKITLDLNFKENFMLEFVRSCTSDGSWVSPSKVGRHWGKTIKGRNDYNAGHSRRVLLKLVSMGFLAKNSEGHYQAI